MAVNPKFPVTQSTWTAS